MHVTFYHLHGPYVAFTYMCYLSDTAYLYGNTIISLSLFCHLQLKGMEYTDSNIPVRHGEVEDDTGRAKLSLWRQAATNDLPLNSILMITDVLCVNNKGSEGKVCINVNFPDEIQVHYIITFAMFLYVLRTCTLHFI